MEKLGLNLGYLLVQLFNFGIAFVVIYVWAVKPIMKMLEKRRQTIAQGLEDAREAADARANAEREARAILEKAQGEAAELIRLATERAEKVQTELHATSEKEAAKAREAAMADIEQERNRMLSELRNQVASLSVAAAQKLIGASLIQDEQRQHALLNEFFAGVKDGKVVVLEGAEIAAGDQAEITSALPLNETEQAAIKKDLAASLAPNAEIRFRVDPSILGGLIVRVGDRIVDRSVAGQLQGLRQNLQ